MIKSKNARRVVGVGITIESEFIFVNLTFEAR